MSLPIKKKTKQANNILLNIKDKNSQNDDDKNNSNTYAMDFKVQNIDYNNSLEVKINKWLDEKQLQQTDPREKELKYYQENKLMSIKKVLDEDNFFDFQNNNIEELPKSSFMIKKNIEDYQQLQDNKSSLSDKSGGLLCVQSSPLMLKRQLSNKFSIDLKQSPSSLFSEKSTMKTIPNFSQNYKEGDSTQEDNDDEEIISPIKRRQKNKFADMEDDGGLCKKKKINNKKNLFNISKQESFTNQENNNSNEITETVQIRFKSKTVNKTQKINSPLNKFCFNTEITDTENNYSQNDSLSLKNNNAKDFIKEEKEQNINKFSITQEVEVSPVIRKKNISRNWGI